MNWFRGMVRITPAPVQYEFKPNRRDFLHARYRLESQSPWFSRMEVHAARQVITDDRLTQDWDSPVVTTEENESQLDGLTLQFNTPWGGSRRLRQRVGLGL